MYEITTPKPGTIHFHNGVAYSADSQYGNTAPRVHSMMAPMANMAATMKPETKRP